jgi:hypothetical protein
MNRRDSNSRNKKGAADRGSTDSGHMALSPF